MANSPRRAARHARAMFEFDGVWTEPSDSFFFHQVKNPGETFTNPAGEGV
jgi:hypothetical protein